MNDQRPTTNNQQPPIWRDLLWITAVSLLIQAFWAARLTHPSYFDAYYYTTNGQRLADGYGFTEEIIWQYLDDPAGLPTPSLTYWMPLPAIIAAVGYSVSDSFRAAQFPFWLMAGLLPLMSYFISWRLSGGQRWQARTAALFTAAGGYYAAYWNQPSTFALYAWTGGGCLLALALAQTLERDNGRKRAWFAAGLLAGLSHLARADGILLLAVGGWVWLLGLRRGAGVRRPKVAWCRGEKSPLHPITLSPLLLFLAGYLLIMFGWFWRTWQVTGRPLSTVGTETIFLTNYDDLFAYGRHANPADYFAWGWGNIIQSKLEALWLAAQTFIGVTGLTIFTFFFVWAWIKLGRDEKMRRFLRPFTWYTPIVFGAMSLIFTFPGQRGSLLHTSTALWPWSMALAAAGIGFAVDWMAARLPHWQPEKSKPLFASMFIVVVFAISLAVSGGQPLRDENAAIYAEINAVLPPDAIVMSGDAPGFYYHTDHPAIIVPNEPPQILPEIAARYGATYLILDEDRPKPLADFYEGKVSLPQIRPIQRFGKHTILYRFEGVAR
ncbi:MAG: hypothetical protein H6667_24750 [Ardenticatenaceae bacterium]|nr:hypothetical protein [Ardenticatenaceae bacterium]MCB9446351.1 hypothetical protein [Ardenticatenaceae bacterium]